MKKLSVRVLAMVGAMLLLGTMLCACGKSDKDSDKDVGKNGYTITLKGVETWIGQTDDVRNTYGEPQNYDESGACAGIPGMDRVYQYTGFTIYTTPADGDKNVINKIELTDDTYSTAEGVAAGVTKDTVRMKMGDPSSETATSWFYAKDDMQLVFTFGGDGTVRAILYQTK